MPDRRLLGIIAFSTLSAAAAAQGTTCYSGICFPQGNISFADALVGYDPAHSGLCVPTNGNFTQPTSALGPPDFTNTSSPGAVALGSGGRLEVAFVDNLLTNSGNNGVDDLHIFEVGPLVEASDVAVRPKDAATVALLMGAGLIDADGDGFWEVGAIGGSVASLDLDAWAIGFAAGQLRFDAVQLIDDPLNNPVCNATVGADIDAVGAITTSPQSGVGQEICAPAALNSSGLAGRIEAFGSNAAGVNDVTLLATQLPTGSFGYFLGSRQTQTPVMPPSSQGRLCLGGSIGRYAAAAQIRRTGLSGTFGLVLELPMTPQPTGFVSVLAGETWYYQTWFRDVVGGMPTSNFTDATKVDYQ
ncbi:MAG: hypothetical protein ACI80K_003981 [Paracoccaceae bacterium]|jgi:hypothetical protein